MADEHNVRRTHLCRQRYVNALIMVDHGVALGISDTGKEWPNWNDEGT